MNNSNADNHANEQASKADIQKKPSQKELDKMHRILEEAIKQGKTPGELADEVFKKMFE